VTEQASYILEKESPGFLRPKYLLYGEKQSTPGISETHPVSSVAKWLAREATTQHIKIWNPLIRELGIIVYIVLNLSNIPGKASLIVRKKMRVALTEKMLVGFSGRRIPFTCEYAFAAPIFS
jgi:hypothetical protein